MTIPDIALNGAGSGITTGGSQTVQVGAVSDSINGWNTTGIANIFSFSLWENGSAMSDGRVFQITCFCPQSSNSPGLSVASYPDGPKRAIPIVTQYLPTQYVLGNMPIVYVKNSSAATGLSTCFYYDPTGFGTACFFDGAFYVGGPYSGSPFTETFTRGIIPHYMLPISIDAAQVAGSPLSGLDSSIYSWCIAGTALFPSLIPYNLDISSIGTGAYYALDERRCLNRQYAGIVPALDFFGQAMVLGQIASTSASRSFDLSNGHGNAGDLRTYRRAATSASYDWRGWITYV